MQCKAAAQEREAGRMGQTVQERVAIMVEELWLALTAPGVARDELLIPTALGELERLGRHSKRKERLVACGLCRLLWRYFTNSRCKASVEASELYADGAIKRKQLDAARTAAKVCVVNSEETPLEYAATSVAQASISMPFVISLTRDAARLLRVRNMPVRQAQLLHDIFNPFRPVTLDPTWRTNSVVNLTQAIYDDRAFERLPLLADALEDAGCHHEDILAHCRGPGPHVRGCWVVDLLTGRA